MPAERLQKIIAKAGVTSRRKAEALIAAGRVAVNGTTVRELGTRADPDRDRITLDGKPLLPEPKRYLVVNKPPGVICALRDRFERPLITDLLGEEIRERVFPAGRLDFDSEGLVLLTNDGDLMESITRPGRGVAKVYEVSLDREPNENDIRLLAQGVVLDGQTTLPCTIRYNRRRSVRVWPRSIDSCATCSTRRRRVRSVFWCCSS